MLLKPMSKSQLAERRKIADRVAALQRAGICPSCSEMETGEVYPSAEDRVLFEDEQSLCMLELYPRNPGHTIVLVKPHYEDISQLPIHIGANVSTLIHGTIDALKNVTGSEKVYVCTMCDGERNHLHSQPLPRLPGDNIRGSRLFVKERSMLTGYEADITRLKVELTKARGWTQNVAL